MFNRVQLLCSKGSRGFRSSAIRRQQKDGTTNQSSAIKKADEQIKTPAKDTESVGKPANPVYEVSKFPDIPKYKVRFVDKFALVWSGHFKTRADVPAYVDYHVIHKSRSWSRIRINLFTMFVGLCLCVSIAMMGKMDRRKGKSIAEDNRKWHEEQAAKYTAAQAEKEK